MGGSYLYPVGGGFKTSLINLYKDLSTQIDGITATFDVGESFTNLRVLYNGRDQSQCILSTLGTTFTLDFVPNSNQHLAVYYDKP